MRYFLFYTLLLLFIPRAIFAATTGLSQSSFEISGAPMSVSSNELWVSNVDAIRQKYALALDSDLLKDNISFSPREFLIDPGESQKIIVRFRQMENPSKTYLSLLSFDSNQPNNFKIASGIKIPVRFAPDGVLEASQVSLAPEYGANGQWGWLIWIIDSMLLIFFAFKIRARVLRAQRKLTNKNFFYE